MRKVSKFRRGITTVLAAITLAILPGGAALAQSGAQDCDDNAAIRCGAQTVQDLKQKYKANQEGNLQALYRYFGINSASDLNGMVPGHVDTANNVYVDNKDGTYTPVGQNAFTAGRQDISNKFGSSTPILNGQFYKRSIQTAIGSKNGTLDAFIKLDTDGKFLFGVITSCGNPVNAVAVVPKTPKPQPKPQQPQQPKQPQTPSTPTATTQPAQELPKTGAGGTAGLFAVATVAGTLGYRTYLSRKLR